MVVSAALVYVLYRYVGGMEGFLRISRTLRWELVPLAVLSMSFSVVLSAIRWRFVLLAMGHPVSVGRALATVLGAWPIAALSPSRAGDFARAYLLRDVVPPLEGAGSVLAEKAVDVQSLCLLTIVGGAIAGEWRFIGFATLTLAGAWGVAILLLKVGTSAASLPILRRAPEKVKALFAAFDALRHDPIRFLAVCLTSLIAWINAIGLVWLLGLATGAGFGLLDALALWPLAIFVGLLPVAFAGLGTRDGAFLVLLEEQGVLGIDPAAVIATTLLYALIATWLPAIVGLPLMAKDRPARVATSVAARPSRAKDLDT